MSTPSAALHRILLWLCAGLTAFAMACAAHAREPTVLAAASLKDALDAAAQVWRGRTGERIVVSHASSSALARQIENRAPADIFISADIDWMDYVEKRGLLKAGTRVNLLRNELVLVAPVTSTTEVEIKPGFPLAALLGQGRLAMGDPDHVPAGRYGKAALETLGVWAVVQARVARAENVRAALNFVARAEAPLGIVYRTDAAAERKVRVVGVFPAGSHPPIVYPMAVLAESRSPGTARLHAFLASPEGIALFRKHGFVPY